MQRNLLMITILALIGVLVWLIVGWQPQQHNSPPFELASPPQGGDFTLEAFQGRISLSDFRGQVVLLYFGYTWCPDICPTNLSLIGAILGELSPAERKRVQPLFISVDPDRDTLQRLKTYTEYFHPDLIGLTGSKTTLTKVSQQYGAAYQINKVDHLDHYTVDHTADTYLIDSQGHLVKVLPHGTEAEALLRSVRGLLVQND
jgi:protein SCO1/2